MNQKPKNSLTTIIIVILLAVVPLILFYLKAIPIFIGYIAVAIVIACHFSTVFKEKKSDKKAEKIMDDFKNGSYFNSAEWREKYLNHMQNYQFEEISPKGMKDDLQRRYRKMIYPSLIFFGAFIIFLLCCVLYADTENKIFAIAFILLFGAVIFYIGIKSITRPVKIFYKVNYDFNTVENSYKNGKMMTYKRNGINIGRDYTVIYEYKRVYAIKNSNIRYVTRALVRRKTYRNGEFAKDKYFNKLYIKANNWEYMVELDEYQIETAINELSKV